MTTFYKATFANGHVETRSTAGRKYSHCYRVHGSYQRQPWDSEEDQTVRTVEWNRSGWAARADLADKAARGWGSAYSGIDNTEIVPAIEITAQEYRAMKKAK
jgi:hypothetical protein